MTVQRRTLLAGLVAAAFAASARAQRVTQPIARPVRPFVAGRFDDDGGVASGTPPSVYVVVAVDMSAETLNLRDEGGHTGIVHVNGDIFDLNSLKPGDEVEVDFMVPDPGSKKLEAGGLWKIQR